jgi:4-amino-4-deoxy-L-arabinose transferase-like glycosyltransferase
LVRLPAAVWLIAGGMTLVLLAVAGAYGFHRDELYFILAGRHPDFGYVDQPPLTPLLSAAAAGLLGVSPLAVRIVPTLAAGAGVLLAAEIARRLGASRSGQVLAALVLAISGWLGAGHLDETATYDVLFWTLALWLLVPLLDVNDGDRHPWRWLALGLVVGVGLENKTLLGALPLTVGASLVAFRRWDILRSPWPSLAGLLAATIWAPNVAWQVAHGFTQVEMAQQIAGDQGGLEGRVKALIELLALTGPFLFPVAVAGVEWLLRDPRSRPWRPLGAAIILQLGLMLIIGGKSYYSAGFLPFAVAAGSVPLGAWLEGGRRRLRRAAFGAAATLSGAAVALLLLPIVPVSLLHTTPIPTLYQESAAQVGWPELAAEVAAVADRLPPGQRSHAVVVTVTYGEYSALTLLGSHLPPVFSGHNSTWSWGRPSNGAEPIVLVGWGAVGASTYFEGCRVAAIVDNGVDLETPEQGSAIRVCAEPRRPWADLWPSLRHVD